MTFSDIPVPEVYKESADFRFFLRWIELCFSELGNKTNGLINLLDPQRCPSEFLWMLGDTCGYKYDDRMSKAFNRLVLLYFAKLIRYRGCYNGITFAAQLNLAQFNLLNYAKENEALEDRLEDTSVPVNAVYVSSNVEKGYIDIVYYSENIPTDACLEYVRPIGMYCFTHAGVSVNARTKVSIDARLAGMQDLQMKPSPTFVAHYRREDYARLQKYLDPETDKLAPRRPVYKRNMKYEGQPTIGLDPGYRSLYSLQLSNNEHIVKALLPSLEEPEKIFDIGYGPQNVETVYPDDYLKDPDNPMYNLRLNRELEESYSPSVYTVEQADDILTPKPAVNPPMVTLGDAISLNNNNTKYTKYDRNSDIIKVEDTN